MLRLVGVAVLLGLDAAACGGGGAEGRTGPGGAAGGGGGAGAIGTNACAPLLPTEPPSMGAMLGLVEARLVAAGRQDAGFATVFGTRTDDILGASDALQAQAVEAAAADHMIPLPVVPPADLPDPMTCGVTMSALTSGGQSWEGTTFLATGNLLIAIDGSTGDVSYPPREMTVTDPVTGNVVLVERIETDVSLSLAQSQAKAVVTTRRSANAWTPAGVSLGTTMETATATIDVDFCPDAMGVAAGMITFTGHGTAAPGDGGAPTSYDVEAMGAYRIHVNAMAETAFVDLDAALTLSATGGSSPDLALTFSGGYTDTTNAGGSLSGQTTIQRQSGSDADLSAATHAIYVTALLGSSVAERAAKKKWQGGACVEVRVDPASEMVEPNARITVTATPFQKLDNKAIDAPVVATLTDVQSLDPVNRAVPPPATFTYVAGSKRKDHGTVNLKSTSNRGIGTGTATYTVKCDTAMGGDMDMMCKSIGQVLDPDTCTCTCKVDPVFGNTSPYCLWMGTAHISANTTSQGSDASGTWTSSFTYDAPLSLMTGSDTLIHATGTLAARFRVVTMVPLGDCIYMKTDDAGFSGSVDWVGGEVTEMGHSLEIGVALRGSMLAGTTTISWSDPNCGGDSVFPIEVPLTIFRGGGTAAGATFKGTSTDLSGPMLPDGTYAPVQVTFDLHLVQVPANP